MDRALLWTSQLAAVLVSSVAAQSTVVVTGGSGALNAAVQQASPGDRLIVRAARYHALLVDRGLIIECDAGVQFAADVSSGGPSRIAGVPAGQSLLLRGGEIVASALFTRVEISQCAGIVTWVAPRFQFAAMLFSTIAIEHCNSVTLEAPDFPMPPMSWTGTWRITATNSAVAISDSTSGAPIDISGGSLTLDDVDVSNTYTAPSLLATSALIGIRGGTFPGSSFNHGTQSLPGIVLRSADLTITGGAVVTSGPGSVGPSYAISGQVRSRCLRPSRPRWADWAPSVPSRTLHALAGASPRQSPLRRRPRRRHQRRLGRQAEVFQDPPNHVHREDARQTASIRAMATESALTTRMHGRWHNRRHNPSW
jgi:hypothetical protein